MKRNNQRGIVLVITLIMLSVVTFMAVAFLALSRRERGSVTVTTSQTTAALMADAAVARAQAEIQSRIQARTNFGAIDLVVSTNYINPLGFTPSGAHSDSLNLSNVNYSFVRGAGAAAFRR